MLRTCFSGAFPQRENATRPPRSASVFELATCYEFAYSVKSVGSSQTTFFEAASAALNAQYRRECCVAIGGRNWST